MSVFHSSILHTHLPKLTTLLLHTPPPHHCIYKWILLLVLAWDAQFYFVCLSLVEEWCDVQPILYFTRLPSYFRSFSCLFFTFYHLLTSLSLLFFYLVLSRRVDVRGQGWVTTGFCKGGKMNFVRRKNVWFLCTFSFEMDIDWVCETICY